MDKKERRGGSRKGAGRPKKSAALVEAEGTIRDLTALALGGVTLLAESFQSLIEAELDRALNGPTETIKQKATQFLIQRAEVLIQIKETSQVSPLTPVLNQWQVNINTADNSASIGVPRDAAVDDESEGPIINVGYKPLS